MTEQRESDRPHALTVGVVSARPGRRHRLIAGLLDAGFSVIAPGESPAVIVFDGVEPVWEPGIVAAVFLVENEGEAATKLHSPRPAAALTTDASPDEIGAAVRAVAEGLTVIAPEFTSILSPSRWSVPTIEPNAATDITPREIEVLQLLALGLPNKAIAPRLGISENTVKYHVAAILSKLDAQSRAEAVMLAVRLGLVPL